MPSSILVEARTYLINSLEGKSNRRETRHPWRKSWEFVVLHSLRVESYVLKILEQESHTLGPDDITLLRLAAIPHDIGRLEQVEPHAQVSAEMTSNWLSANPDLARQITGTEKLSRMISKHSYKDASEDDFSCAVLKDADILDEIGALSICMSMNWIDSHSPFFFQQLLGRLSDFEIQFCEIQLAKLNTNTGRQILSTKKQFIEAFIGQLRSELEGTQEITALVNGAKSNQ